MKPSKCVAWRQHNPTNCEPVIPDIRVDTGLMLLEAQPSMATRASWSALSGHDEAGIRPDR